MKFLHSILIVIVLLTASPAQESGSSSGVISSRDNVEIRVFREDDLTTSGQLSEAGTITMPLIGAVRLAGLSTDAAAKVIEARLLDGYLVRPEVSVSISGRVRQSVTVLGQVRNPGVFRLDANRQLTLIEAIGMAGGMTRIANSKKVTLKRRDAAEPRIVNVREIAAGKQKDIALSDGDIISIPESLF